MRIVASIANPKTDSALRDSEFRKGQKAFLKGKDEKSYPWPRPSLTYDWWLEGYNFEKRLAEQQPPKNKQVVVCAAMRNKDGDIICSPRHFDEIASLQVKSEWVKWRTAEQGFVDQYGTFLTREEAWVIAEANGQIIRRVGGDGEKLFSENLY